MITVANAVLLIATTPLPRAANPLLMTKKIIQQRTIPPRTTQIRTIPKEIIKVKLAASSKRVVDRGRTTISQEEVGRTPIMEDPVGEVTITVAVETREELTHSTIEAKVTMAAITMVEEIIRVTEAVAIMIKGTTEMHHSRATAIVMKATGVCEARATELLAIATIVLLEGGKATPMPRVMANSNETVMTTSPLITMRQAAMATTTAEVKTTEVMVVSTSPATTTQIKETGKIEHLPHSTNQMIRRSD